MNSPAQRIGVAAITENLLKRKWSSIILRHLNQGITDPIEIAKIETDISPKVMSERLRTMVRYGLIARFPRPSPSSVIEYRLTSLGKKILEMIETINLLDQQIKQSRSPLGGHLDDISDDSGAGESIDRTLLMSVRRLADS
jgi:DNA-binding HxlR family transcriptional regulator